MKTFKTLALTILGICASAGSAYAQLNATNAFASAPQSVFPLLDKNARLDMIDYFASGSDTPSRNKLDGSSRISELNDYSVKIKMTDASDYQWPSCPPGPDSLIAVISTVATPAHDSHISFYDRSWKKLPDTYFTAPAISDWLNADGKKSPDMVTSMVPFMLAEYVYNPETKSLTLTNNLNEFMSEDTESMISPYLLPSLEYKWDGKRFNKVK